MSKTASAVLNQARAWLGKKESDGSHREIIDVYNNGRLPGYYKMTYTDAWCACFVSAVAIKCGCTDIIPIEVGCERMIERFKAIGEWVERDSYLPSPGDIIFYDWDDNGVGDNTGFSDHVGIVETVGNNLTIIEGNCTDSVKRRTIALDARYIRGYGVPKYSDAKAPAKAEAVSKKETTTKAETPAKKSVAEVAAEVRKGMWGNGAARINKLKAAGYDPAEVQKAVNQLMSGKKVTATTTKTDTKDIEAVARDVIKGLYGNGVARTMALKAAGYDPTEVQRKVNELWKK